MMMGMDGLVKIAPILILAMAMSSGSPQPVAFGAFGTTLEQAQKTDFFQFFNMERTGETKQGDKTVVTFQPSGGAFHELARVNMTLNAKGNIAGAELVLARSFVDSPKNGIFARDIAKSFLGDAVNTEDGDRVAGLAGEIHQLTGTQSTVIVHSGAIPAKPTGAPSEGYLVYLGQRDAFQDVMPHGQTLTMENKDGLKSEGGGRVLRIGFRVGS